MNTKFSLPLFFSIEPFWRIFDGGNSINPESKSTYHRVIGCVFATPRKYKIKYMYLYIAVEATLNTGNDYSTPPRRLANGHY